METLQNGCLVEGDWLEAHLEAPDLAILDCSWHWPDSGRDAKAEYAEKHIPGALFFDIDEIADTDSPYPHMLASPVKFASRMRKMGIGDGMRVVVYDSEGLWSAPRVWWNFRVMGATDVAVLNGGLAKWCEDGRPLEDMPPKARTERHFTARRHSELVRDLQDIEANLTDGRMQVVDARSPGRFKGAAPEPHAGLRSGRIPGAFNLYYRLLADDDGTLLEDDELRDAFDSAGLSLDKPMVASCGSGVTAAIIALAAAKLGYPQVAIYDGSWAEWGADDTLPIETG